MIERDFFLPYLAAAMQLSLRAVQGAGAIVPDAEREQAWHLLSYALRHQEAWSLARQLLLTLAPKMEQVGFRSDWLAYLQQGVACADQLGDTGGAAEINLHIGQLHRLTSQFEAARQVLGQSLAYFHTVGDNRGRVRVLNHLAYVEWQALCIDEASCLAEEAFQLGEGDDAEAQKERATTLSVLGLVAMERLHWAESEGYHRQALAIRQGLGLVRECAFSLQNLGVVLAEQRHLAEAIACYEQALQVLSELKDSYHCAVIQMNLGKAYHEEQEYERAVDLYLQAEGAFRRHQSQRYLLTVNTNQAVTYLAREHWAQAEQYFLQCIAGYTELGNDMWRLLTTDGLAETYLGQQRYAEAIILLDAVQREIPKLVNQPYYDYLCNAVQTHLSAAQAGVQR